MNKIKLLPEYILKEASEKIKKDEAKVIYCIENGDTQVRKIITNNICGNDYIITIKRL